MVSACSVDTQTAKLEDSRSPCVPLRQTAKHLGSFAANSPFANFINPPNLRSVVGTEAQADSGSVGSTPSNTEKVDDKEEKVTGEEEEPTTETEEKKRKAMTDTESAKNQTKAVDSVDERKAEASTAEPKLVADTESFLGVHESAYLLSKKYHAQYSDYLLGYVENWERVVSTRMKGLLIHYRELQDNVAHYNKKVLGLLSKVDKSKNVRQKLAEKLDRNEIKEVGAVEVRDIVGEHLYLYIEEVMDRAWRDVFPLLLRSCRFEADFSTAQANLLANLVAVSENIQVTGEDEGCDVMGRLEDLEKKHQEELTTEDNPFVKLTPTKNKNKQPLEGESASDESHDVGQMG